MTLGDLGGFSQTGSQVCTIANPYSRMKFGKKEIYKTKEYLIS